MLPQIVDISEVLAYVGLGGTATAQQHGLLEFIKHRAEAAIRKYLRCSVAQATYTHILPADNPWDLADGIEPDRGPVLLLPEFPVRSIDSIYEDRGARFGQTAGAFPESSLLVPGVDYYLSTQTENFSRHGRVVRIGKSWPSEPGSIKVAYTAGWTQSELQGDVDSPEVDASDLHLAVLTAISGFWSLAEKHASGSGGDGVIKSERIADYRVEFDTSAAVSSSSEKAYSTLSKEVRDLLAPYRRVTI